MNLATILQIKPSIQELIERCWSQNPNERQTFKEIYKKLAFNDEKMFMI